jgi:hypothetical protein
MYKNLQGDKRTKYVWIITRCRDLFQGAILAWRNYGNPQHKIRQDIRNTVYRFEPVPPQYKSDVSPYSELCCCVFIFHNLELSCNMHAVYSIDCAVTWWLPQRSLEFSHGRVTVALGHIFLTPVFFCRHSVLVPCSSVISTIGTFEVTTDCVSVNPC